MRTSDYIITVIGGINYSESALKPRRSWKFKLASNVLAYPIYEHTVPTHAIWNSLVPRLPHRLHGCKSYLVKLVPGH